MVERSLGRTRECDVATVVNLIIVIISTVMTIILICSSIFARQ